ncbi:MULTISPECIES: hypothetical protein [unclassified Streptomyces]|uniref:hypothetical protein n=1 Tax=unclassified Streptomyces TaxID=2593676 RepID=UPI00386DB25F|nr:hypothetical protein OH827_28610 [Streptomyces sp. NBC_00891]WSY08745.1 hypothetical protein OG464_28610 [Streptomyces sp. NBC_00890]WSZ22129.1 hypothetical protein OG498_04955 [Streptomyces sp. NBC_00870]
MTVHQEAVSAKDFALHLRELVALLDPGRGWYGVFRRRDPAGMDACLNGVELPPWDVMESLFADLAQVRGTAYAEQAAARAARLHADCARGHDRRPGGRAQLLERLGLMLREQAYAAERLRAAQEAGDGDRAADVLAWARDDHARAAARCAELRRRVAAVPRPQDRFGAATAAPDRANAQEPAPPMGPAFPESAPVRPSAQEPAPQVRPAAPEPAPPMGPAAPEPPRSKKPTAPASAPHEAAVTRRRKPTGARFAGLEPQDARAVDPATALPAAPAASPRGARFGGGPAPESAERPTGAQDPAALRSAQATVGALLRLRAEGRSGEAHAVLCEAAALPAHRLPLLAVELHRAGLGADWATLLWEAASLPPDGLAAAVDALAAAGRAEDCDRLLRQGVARPAAEIAEAAAALDRAGRSPLTQTLLGAFVRLRSPQEAAGVASIDPPRLVPQLLAAARTVSEARERGVEHALRVAGLG